MAIIMTMMTVIERITSDLEAISDYPLKKLGTQSRRTPINAVISPTGKKREDMVFQGLLALKVPQNPAAMTASPATIIAMCKIMASPCQARNILTLTLVQSRFLFKPIKLSISAQELNCLSLPILL